MTQNELDRLRAVLPSYMKLLQDAGGTWTVYDEHHDELISLKNEHYASDALQLIISLYASAGRKRGNDEALKPLRDALGITHSLNDVHQRIGALNTRLIEVEERLGVTTTTERHQWDAAGERCEKCGDKDWMGSTCSGDRSTAPQQQQANAQG